MRRHDDIIKEWVLLLFQWAKEWYEKSQLDQWIQFLLDKLWQFWSLEIAQIIFWTMVDPHKILFWLLIGVVVYLPIVWLLLRKSATSDECE